MAYKNFKVETDADGIALVTWDIPQVDERARRDQRTELARSSSRPPATPR